MNPDIRVYAIVTLFVLFAALSLYSTVSAIYSLGRNDGERIRIEHLQRLAPQPGHQAGILRELRCNAAAGSSLSR